MMNQSISDPIASLSFEEQAFRGSQWWSHPANKKARTATGDLEQSGVAELLALGEWDDKDKFDKKGSRSLMAWRGLWVGPSLGLIEQALDQDLAPPTESGMDWWARAYFRSQALRAIFLPLYPTPTPDAPASSWEDYARLEEDRKSLARKIHDRYPQLLVWMVEGLDPKRSVYSHPLMICARQGSEEEFARFSSVVSLRDLLGLESSSSPDSPTTPSMTPSKLLETGLRRSFQPLVDLALEYGATANDPVYDFKGAERSMLHSAIAGANRAAVDWLMGQQVDLERWDRMAHTPFLVAARMADIETMEKLAAAGANIHATDRFGRTAAHLVVESIRTQEIDLERLRKFDERVYTDRTPQAIELALTRAGQALDVLSRLGVDLAKPCAPNPKNTKKSPSPFAHLPRSNRSKFASKPGETWEDFLSRKCADDPLLGEKGLAWIRSIKLEAALAIVPPEPEEGEEGPPMPPPAPRPRVRM